MKAIEKTEALLNECEADLQKIIQFNKDIEIIEHNLKQLKEYYQEQYLLDIEKYKNSNKHYKALNQDSIWNVLEEQHEQKKQILKKIIDAI